MDVCGASNVCQHTLATKAQGSVHLCISGVTILTSLAIKLDARSYMLTVSVIFTIFYPSIFWSVTIFMLYVLTG